MKSGIDTLPAETFYKMTADWRSDDPPFFFRVQFS
jgi:hypothetical protein